MSSPLKGPLAMIFTIAGIGILLIVVNPQLTIFGQLLIISAISWIGSTVVSNHRLAQFYSTTTRGIAPSPPPPPTGPFLTVTQLSNTTLTPQITPTVSYQTNNFGDKTLSVDFQSQNVTNTGNTISQGSNQENISFATQNIKQTNPQTVPNLSIVRSTINPQLQVFGPSQIGLGITTMQSQGNEGFATTLFQSNRKEAYRLDSMPQDFDSMGDPILLYSENILDESILSTYLLIQSTFTGPQSNAITLTNEISNQTAIVNNVQAIWNYEGNPIVKFNGLNGWTQRLIMYQANPTSTNTNPIVVAIFQANPSNIPLTPTNSTDPFIILDANAAATVRFTCMNGVNINGSTVTAANATLGFSDPGGGLYTDINWLNGGQNSLEFVLASKATISAYVSGTTNTNDTQYILAITIQQNIN